MTSQVVAPRPYADSFSTSGTVSNTSRMTGRDEGETMIASTKLAERMRYQTGDLERACDDGQRADPLNEEGLHIPLEDWRENGYNPQMRTMMLGTAAILRWRRPRGDGFIQEGASSVRKKSRCRGLMGTGEGASPGARSPGLP